MSINTRSISVALTPSALQMNQKASATASLYYICLTLKSRLSRLPDMAPYLALAGANTVAAHEQQQQALAALFARVDALEAGSRDSYASMALSGLGLPEETVLTFVAGLLPVGAEDPVTQLWKLCQQGSPLCLLFNAIKPALALPVVASDDLRVCKKSVYDFLIACKLHLGFQDDDLFTILDVFANQSEGFLKVVRVLNAVCDLSRRFELGADEAPRPPAVPHSPRGKVLLELVETERKYVQDLTVLHTYKTRLAASAQVPPDLIHSLFPNLTALLDFQRRLLVALEINYVAPVETQTVGSVFVHARGYFRGYESWCTGSKASQELIERERSKLDVGVLDVGVELMSYLIKPIQRLCKYPLLMRGLVKTTQEVYDELLRAARAAPQGPQGSQGPQEPRAATPAAAAHAAHTAHTHALRAAALAPTLDDLTFGLKATRSTASMINEQTRKQENAILFRQLLTRVSNWRGYDISSFGDLSSGLALEVKDNDFVRSFWCYLFDEIVLFFKDSGPPSTLKKKKKSSASFANLISGSSSSLHTPPPAADPQPAALELKGRIYTLNIYKIQASPPASQLWGGPNPNPAHFLLVGWTGGADAGVFVLRFPNEEVRAQFETMLRRVVGRQRALRERESEGQYALDPSGFIDDESRRSSASLRSTSSYSVASRHASELYPGPMPDARPRAASSSERSYSLHLYRSASGASGLASSVQNLSLGSTTSSSSSSPSHSALTLSHINVQLTYGNEPLFLQLSPATTWSAWCDLVYHKVESIMKTDQRKPVEAFVYKYQDEDGDWVMLGARDWEDVMEWCVQSTEGAGLCVEVS